MSQNHYPGAGHGPQRPGTGHGGQQPSPWGTGGAGSPAQGGPVAPVWTPLSPNRAPQRFKRGPVLILVLLACVVCVVIGVLVYLHSAATGSADVDKLASGLGSPTWQVEGDVIDAHAPLNPSSDWLRGQEEAWRIPAPEGELDLNYGARFGRGSLIVTSHQRPMAVGGVVVQGWDVSGDEPRQLWRKDTTLSKAPLVWYNGFWVGDTLISGNAIVNAGTGDIVAPSWLWMTDYLAVAGDTIIACKKATTTAPAKCTGRGFNGKRRWEAEPPEGTFQGFENIADPAGLRSLGYKVRTSETDDRMKALYALDAATGTFTKVREYSAEQCRFRTLIDGWAFACFDDGAVSLYDHTGALVDTIVPTEPPLRLSVGTSSWTSDRCYVNAVPFWNHDPTMDELRAYYRDGDDSGTEGTLAYSEDCKSFTYREPGSGGAVHSFDSYGMTRNWLKEYDAQPGAIRLPARVSQDRKILVLRGYLYFDVDSGEFLADTSLINDELGGNVVAPEPNLILGKDGGDVPGYRPSK